MNIVLTTLNARYAHTSIALRYLYANLKEFKDVTTIQEYTINDNIQEIAEKILKSSPTIIGIGVYIWNALAINKLIYIIKRISPETKIVLGGPEASHEPFRVDFSNADYIIKGEGELSLYNLIKDINSGNLQESRVINAITPDLNSIELPYKYYTDHDIANRVIYVEASRGCPFFCEFCLSSADKRVRNFNTDDLLAEFQTLWERGARNFKFIDRTFNLSISKTNLILDFFLTKDEDYLVHFEVIPEHFPEELKKKIKRFSPGKLQLEVGIQTLQPKVAERINRKMNFNKIKENLNFLETETNAHLHVDLIIGLPGESVEQFGENLNILGSLTNCEIQLGVLKKLSGTTINRHDIKYGMLYSDEPPYDILQNDLVPYLKMQEMKRFARYWDIAYNSGNFKETILMLWPDGDIYKGFYDFSTWIYNKSATTFQISLSRLAEYIFEYLTTNKDFQQPEVADSIVRDLTRTGGRKIPGFLRDHATFIPKARKNNSSEIGKRQQRHL